MKKIIAALAVLGPVYYLPFNGTVATLCTLPLVYALHSFGAIWYAVITVLLFFLAVPVCKIAAQSFANPDDSRIVADEVVGTLVTFFLVPLTSANIFFGVLLFRFFDISKIWCVGWCEKIEGPWGVVLDDVVAGLFSCVILLAVGNGS